MKWRRFLTVTSALFLTWGGLFSVAPATAYATSSSTSSSHEIWCGLWVGSNLHISDADMAQCMASFGSSQQSSGNASPTSSSSSMTSSSSSNLITSYVALGDSVAAGLGLPQSSSATAQDVQCGRSPQAYPDLVATRIGLPLTNLACAGATAGNLFTQQHIVGPNPRPQLTRAFANGTPQLMTITAGANDAHWASFLRSCYVTDCTTSTSKAAANAFLSLLQAKLLFAFQDIQTRSVGDPPQVLITGYYNPISANCTSAQLTATEITWLTQETAALNRIIQTSASYYPFVTYVPISFAGHDICSSASWVQGLNSAAPFHPTARGQQAIANVIVSYL